MNKKIISGLISITALCAVMVGGTYAYFSNIATSSNNVFASGTLDVQLANGTASFGDSVTATFGSTTLAPGSCLDSATLNIKNVGTVPANHIDISAANTNTAFASFLKIKVLTLDGNDVVLTDINNNGYRDLQDLGATGITNKPLTDFSVHPLTMQVCLEASAGNEQQGQSNTLNLAVLLDQGPHN